MNARKMRADEVDTDESLVNAFAIGRPISVLPEPIAAQLFAAVIARQDRDIARKRKQNKATATGG